MLRKAKGSHTSQEAKSGGNVSDRREELTEEKERDPRQRKLFGGGEGGAGRGA